MEGTFVGNIQLFPYGFVPAGWLACDGQMLSVAQYAMLGDVVGATYGGDGKNNFALPKLTGPAKGLQYCICHDGDPVA